MNSESHSSSSWNGICLVVKGAKNHNKDAQQVLKSNGVIELGGGQKPGRGLVAGGTCKSDLPVKLLHQIKEEKKKAKPKMIPNKEWREGTGIWVQTPVSCTVSHPASLVSWLVGRLLASLGRMGGGSRQMILVR